MFEINAVKNANIFQVHPIKLDEQNRFEQQGRTMPQAEGSAFSPEHPNMQSSTCANKLDFLA